MLKAREAEEQLARWIEPVQVARASVQTDSEGEVDGRAGRESQAPLPPSGRCATVKLEPRGTTAFLREKQLEDGDIKGILKSKEAGQGKPAWEDVSPGSPATKALWAQWDQLVLTDGFMYRTWEDNTGKRVAGWQIAAQSTSQLEQHQTS